MGFYPGYCFWDGQLETQASPGLVEGPAPGHPFAGRVIWQQSEQAAPYSLPACLGRGAETKSEEEGEHPSHLPLRREG